jgi:hypothetical protein
MSTDSKDVFKKDKTPTQKKKGDSYFKRSAVGGSHRNSSSFESQDLSKDSSEDSKDDAEVQEEEPINPLNDESAEQRGIANIDRTENGLI